MHFEHFLDLLTRPKSGRNKNARKECNVSRTVPNSLRVTEMNLKFFIVSEVILIFKIRLVQKSNGNVLDICWENVLCVIFARYVTEVA